MRSTPLLCSPFALAFVAAISVFTPTHQAGSNLKAPQAHRELESEKLGRPTLNSRFGQEEKGKVVRPRIDPNFGQEQPSGGGWKHVDLEILSGDIMKVCQRSDPQLNQCVIDSIMALRPAVKKGIPELQINSIDPMIVPKLGISQGTGPVSIDSTFKDLHIENWSNAVVQSAKVDFDKRRIELTVTLPWFYTWGDYAVTGQILVLPIRGSGPSWSNYTDVTANAVIQARDEMRKGQLHWTVQDITFDVAVNKATIHMDNLFNGNKALGDVMNQFMSDNWKVVYQELKPAVDEAVASLVGDVAKKVFLRFPIDELLPQ